MVEVVQVLLFQLPLLQVVVVELAVQVHLLLQVQDQEVQEESVQQLQLMELQL